MRETVEKISAAGFEDVVARSLTDMLSTKWFHKAMIEYRHGFPTLTELGRFHRACVAGRQGDRAPYLFGEIKAQKPSKHARTRVIR